MTEALHPEQPGNRCQSETPIFGDDNVTALFAPIREVAEKLGLNRQHLARCCRDKWAPVGMAVMAPPPEGGSPTWYISRRVDARLAVHTGEDFQEPDLSPFTVTQKMNGRQKAECVKEYRKLRETELRSQAKWLPALAKRLSHRFPSLKVSERSLRRWYGLYERPADLVNLISAKGGDKLRGASPESWDWFSSIYLDERQPSVMMCWKRTRDEAKFRKWQWCSYEQCRRQLDERIPPQTQMQFRCPRTYRWKFKPFIEQDPESRAAGLLWIGDHAQLDMMCYHGDKLVRPWVTAWMDWRTRRIAGYVLSVSPDSSTILAALRHGLLDPSNLGGPDEIHIDNGKDYDCYTLHGQTKAQRKKRITNQIRSDEVEAGSVLEMLGIEAHFSIPHNPNGKSRLERWFGPMHEQFDKSFKTYCGSTPTDKPEGLNAILKEPHKVPTFENVVKRFDDYVKGYNADAEHNRVDMKGLSPDQALADWCPRKKVMADGPSLLFCLQTWERPVSVGRNGVTIKPRGRSVSYGQFSHDLAPYKGTLKKVRVSYDPNDLRTIRVWDIEGRFICEAGMNQLGGMSTATKIGRDQVGELIRQQRKYKEAKRIVAKNSHHEYLTPTEILAMGMTDEPKKPERERPLKIQTTPLDGQSKYVEADRLRQAAGGEHDDIPHGIPDTREFFDGIDLGPTCPDQDEDWFDPFEVLEMYDTHGTDDQSGGDRFKLLTGSKGDN